MSLEVNITNIVGTSPFDIYICQSGGTACFYIDTIDTNTYNFNIPPPYDKSLAYMLKVIDNDNCIISGISIV